MARGEKDRDSETFRTSWNIPTYTYWGNPKRRRDTKCQKEHWRNNGWKTPKCDEKYWLIHPRNSMIY